MQQFLPLGKKFEVDCCDFCVEGQKEMNGSIFSEFCIFGCTLDDRFYYFNVDASICFPMA